MVLPVCAAQADSMPRYCASREPAGACPGCKGAKVPMKKMSDTVYREAVASDVSSPFSVHTGLEICSFSAAALVRLASVYCTAGSCNRPSDSQTSPSWRSTTGSEKLERVGLTWRRFEYIFPQTCSCLTMHETENLKGIRVLLPMVQLWNSFHRRLLSLSTLPFSLSRRH